MVRSMRIRSFLLRGMMLLLISVAIPPVLSEEARVSLKWAFLHRSADGATEIIDFKQRPGPTVTAGDGLRIYLEAGTDVYLYLYLYDAARTLHLIFPGDTGFYDSGPVAGGEIHWLPGSTEWFTWDDSRGRERFTILASSKRLEELERLTRRYNDSGGDRSLGSRLYNHIETLRKENSDWASVTEKPVAIAGTVRTRGPNSSKDDLPGEATLVEADGFYGKPLRLRHE